MVKSAAIGREFEKVAATYLTRKNCVIVETNYYCKFGEVDLIVLDNQLLVFVEVRYRSSSLYGSSSETVNRSKQRKIKLAAEYYLQERDLANKVDCRFDVVSIAKEDRGYQIDWHRDAFWDVW